MIQLFNSQLLTILIFTAVPLIIALLIRYEKTTYKIIVVSMSIMTSIFFCFTKGEYFKITILFYGVYILFLLGYLSYSRNKNKIVFRFGEAEDFANPNRNAFGLIYFFMGVLMFFYISLREKDSFNYYSSESVLSELESTSRSLKSSFSEIQSELNYQIEYMESGIDKIIGDLKKKSNDILVLEKKEAKLKADLEYYGKLNSISKEQSETIIKLLRSNKYIDHILGFILGLIASVVASRISFLLRRKKLSESHK